MKFTAIPKHQRIDSHEPSMHPFAEGFLDGMAGMFDIFGVRARPHRETPEDDARNLHRDVERVAEDFRTVLSRLASLPSE